MTEPQSAPSSHSREADLPLKGIRVLDFSKILAGPLCTQYLADMGAEVIKVEPVETGDDTRAWPPFAAPGLGAVFLSANRGKRSIAVNLKTDAGRAIVHRLVADTDVAIESFGGGVAERLGIDEASLRRIRPDLIYCSISGFGRSGPMKDAPGYDVILQAFSGMMALTGEEGGPYVRSPISPVDQTTGIHALTGILAALFARARGQPGRRVEASLFETAMGFMAYNLQSYWIRGVQPARCGSSHESLCPYQAFEAKDGPVMIGVANDSLWRKFCKVAGLEDIVDDPRFRTNPDRAANRAETVTIVQAAIARQTVDWWNRELAAIRVPCTPINSLDRLMAEPQTAATGILLSYSRPEFGEARGVAHPVSFDGHRRQADRPPPAHGEHGAAILSEIGFGPDEIEALAQANVVHLPGRCPAVAGHEVA